MKKFKTDKGFTYPICPDQDKSIYNLYASKFIPRNVVIDKDGKVVFQSVGFKEPEFKKMIETIQNSL